MEQSTTLDALNREIPTPLLDHVWMWSTFSEEKQLFFNGYLLSTPNGLVVIDPPVASEPIFNAIQAIGDLALILVTNRDHEREVLAFHQRFEVPVAIHRLDAPLLSFKPMLAFNDRQILLEQLEMVHIPQQKSPGETAVYDRLNGYLFFGDALIVKPPATVTMLPEDKYHSVALAKQALRDRLLPFIQQHKINAIFPGDGEPLLGDAVRLVETYLSQLFP